MKVRIAYYGDAGTIFSHVEDYGESEITSGDWGHPFPNTKEESTAFGLLECFAQSDRACAFGSEETINRITVIKGD